MYTAGIQRGKQCVSEWSSVFANLWVCVSYEHTACACMYLYLYVPISFTSNKLGSTERSSNRKFKYTPMIIDLNFKTTENRSDNVKKCEVFVGFTLFFIFLTRSKHFSPRCTCAEWSNGCWRRRQWQWQCWRWLWLFFCAPAFLTMLWTCWHIFV